MKRQGPLSQSPHTASKDWRTFGPSREDTKRCRSKSKSCRPDARLEGSRLGRIDVGQEAEPHIERILIHRRDDVLAEGAVVLDLDK